MAVLGASVFAAPDLGAYSWAAIGLCSAGAVVVGIRRNAPPRPLPWWMLGAAILAMALGDTIYGADAQGRSSAPAVADVCYLAMFPLLTIGLVQMVRTSAVLVDWSRMLDLLTFTCAAALLAWVCLIGPSLGANSLDGTGRSTLAAYTLGDLLTLVTTVRLVFAARRNASMILLGVGATALLTADVWYALAALGSGWRPGGPAEAGYLLVYACWGAAALQPSMVRLTEPVVTRNSQLGLRWVALLGLSLAVPPAVMLVEEGIGQVRDSVVLAVASTLMSALVITRLAMALSQHRQAVARERRLRQACGTLVAAGDTAKVSAAVRAAVSDLMPAGLAHAVVLAVHDLPSPEYPGGTGGDPVAGIISRYPLPRAEERRTRLLNTHALHPDLRERLDRFPATLACRLVVNQHDTDDPGLGALLVASEHRRLAAIQDSVEVLAAQASLALERIALCDEFNRRSNEEYLRAMTRNSIDVVVIVDREYRVRYASPSLADILGVDLPALATLRDIVHADDHEQVERTLAAAHRSTQPGGARDWWHLPRPDGSLMTVEVSCRDLRQDRMVRGYVITLRDLTEHGAGQRESIQRVLGASPAAQNRESSHGRFG
jgi:PAS domain S-box-containing protein